LIATPKNVVFTGSTPAAATVASQHATNNANSFFM
jgi:hypothetical protein